MDQKLSLKQLHQNLIPLGLSYKLHFCQKKKVSEEKVTLLIQGRNESMELYNHIVPFFINEMKTDLFLFDLRGQGKSSGLPAHINSFEQYLNDLKIIVESLRALYKNIHIVSHSTGGLISSLFVGLWPEAIGKGGTVCLISPFLGAYATGLQKFLLKKKLKAVRDTFEMLFQFFPKLELKRFVFSPTLNFKENALTTNPYFYKTFDKHPSKCGPPTWGWLHQCFRAHLMAKTLAPKIKTPLFFALAGFDTVVDNKASWQFYLKGKWNQGPWVLKEFRGMKHALFQAPDKTRNRLLKMIQSFQNDHKKFMNHHSIK